MDTSQKTILRVAGMATLVVAAGFGLTVTGAQVPARLGGPDVAAAGTLQRFAGCDAVVGYFKEHAADYLIEQAGGRRRWIEDAVPVAARAEDAAAGAAAGGGAEHSTTNVQEAGVDEPDLVKTDGKRIVAVAQGQVHLISTVDGKLTRRATLAGQSARNVFLSGDRLLVFGDGDERSVLSLYDVADLSAPKRLATLTVDGSVLDARLVGTQVRVVTVATPEVDAPSPSYTRTGQLSSRSKTALRAAVAATTVDDWLPAYTLRDGADREVREGRLVGCSDLSRPSRFSGLSTVAVSAFDLGSTLESRRTVGLVAGGDQIYATANATYVATTDWSPDGPAATTSLHKFVTAPSGRSTYRGSGEVPGRLLSSYALSEYAGVLRAATTVSERRGWVEPAARTQGVVTMLEEQGGALRAVGRVGGLGREDNESIRAVRFIENKGYVVTFRQTDPLYVLDLTDPKAPTMVGELKIPGYSGYLHPVGKDRLLGVGQSGGRDVQFSLFDISNPALPRRIDTRTYSGGAAGAEYDPHAFLYWEPRDLVIAPVSLYDQGTGAAAFNGLVLLRASAGGLTEVGRVAGAGDDAQVSRSLVIGNAVYLLSDRAVQAHDLDTRAEVGRVNF